MTLYYAGMIFVIPLVASYLGRSFVRTYANRYKSILGYRSPMAKKNPDTWRVAHYVLGRTWMLLGVILGLLSGLTVFLYRQVGPEDIEGLFVTIVALQIISLLVAMIPTEMKLRQLFDKTGKRR